jgi:hypothetical protein
MKNKGLIIMGTMNKLSKGTTLLELSIAMLVGSLVLSAAYKSHEYLSKSARRENDKALTQRYLIDATEKLEKNIRMAGVGLPGNGLDAVLSTTTSDELTIYTNEKKVPTKLALNAGWCSTKLVVNDASSAVPHAWMCIASSGVDTLYRRISRIGLNSTGPDTLHMDNYLTNNFYIGADVYFCDKHVYKINKENNKSNLVYMKNDLIINFSDYLDTLAIVPKTYTDVITSDISRAGVINLVIGGYIGKGGNRTLIFESTEVNIRNKD